MYRKASIIRRTAVWSWRFAGGQDEGAEAALFVHRYQQRGDHATTGQSDGLLAPAAFRFLGDRAGGA
ncbi:MAG: hypothetical protein V4675_06860 [Verrucomicrobiota bacterium]